MGVIMDHKWPSEKDAASFYGNPYAVDFVRDNIVPYAPPYPMFYDGRAIGSFQVHRKIKQSLDIILRALWEYYEHDNAALSLHGLNVFAGCYCVRGKRGGGGISVHSYGAAIDFDAARNWRGCGPDQGAITKYSPVVEFFESQDWVWGGDFKTRDPMHFQAAR